MKPLQIGLLVLVGALGGAVIMKFTQRPQPAVQPVAAVAAVPAAPAHESTPAAPPQAAAVPETPAAPQPAEASEPPEPAPKPVVHKPARKILPVVEKRAAPVVVARNQPPVEPPAPSVATPAAPAISEPAAPSMADATPAPAARPELEPEPETPREPETPPSVTLQAGMNLAVRIGQSLSSEHNQPGDTFIGTLDAPLTAGGFVIAERGARVEGRVTEAQKSGRVKSTATLALELTRIHTSDGQQVGIQTEAYRPHATGQSKAEQGGIVAAAAGIGAVIGAIAGGGKGAAIGAGAGGAAGAGGVIATRDKAINLPNEARVTFRLSHAVTVTERVNR